MAVYLMIPCWVQGKGSCSLERRGNNGGTFQRQTRSKLGQRASGLGGTEAGTKEARGLMENKQRRGEKGEGVKGEGRFEKAAGPNIFQTNNAGQKREQSPENFGRSPKAGI